MDVVEDTVRVTYEEASAGYDIAEYILSLNVVDKARNTSKVIQKVTIARNKNGKVRCAWLYFSAFEIFSAVGHPHSMNYRKKFDYL